MTEITEFKPQKKLVEKFAERYSVEPNKLLEILAATCFKPRAVWKNGAYETIPVTKEQTAALLVVADQYGLNPFIKEIFAFPDKDGIIPVVSVDGWSRIMNTHPQCDGFKIEYASESTTPIHGKECPLWIDVTVYRKDRAHSTTIREYLDECYREPFKKKNGELQHGPWQSHTKRFLRHKAIIQACRVVFGFAGIYDQDEAERIVEMKDITPSKPASNAAELNAEFLSAPEQVVEKDWEKWVDSFKKKMSMLDSREHLQLFLAETDAEYTQLEKDCPDLFAIAEKALIDKQDELNQKETG